MRTRVFAVAPPRDHRNGAPLVEIALPPGAGVHQAESTLESVWLRTADGRVWRIVAPRAARDSGPPSAPLLREVAVPSCVAHIACGTSHVLFGTATAPGGVVTRAYALGDNSAGQCGMSTTAGWLPRPTLVPALTRLPLRRLHAGSVFSAAVLTHGGIAVWGGLQGRAGGHPRVLALPPAAFAGEAGDAEGQVGAGRHAGAHVVDVGIGDAHFVVATSAGQVFDFAAPAAAERDEASAPSASRDGPGGGSGGGGSGGGGGGGGSSSPASYSGGAAPAGMHVRHVSPEGPLWGHFAARVAASGATSFALTSRGALFSWGWVSAEWAAAGAGGAAGAARAPRGWRARAVGVDLAAAAGGTSGGGGAPAFVWSDTPVRVGAPGEVWASIAAARTGVRPGVDAYTTAGAVPPPAVGVTAPLPVGGGGDPGSDGAPSTDSGTQIGDAGWYAGVCAAGGSSSGTVVWSAALPPDAAPVAAPADFAISPAAAAAFGNGAATGGFFDVPPHGTGVAVGAGPGPERGRAACLQRGTAPWSLCPLLGLTTGRRIVPIDGGCKVVLVSGADAAATAAAAAVPAVPPLRSTADGDPLPFRPQPLHLLHELLSALWATHVAQARGLFVAVGAWEPPVEVCDGAAGPLPLPRPIALPPALTDDGGGGGSGADVVSVALAACGRLLVRGPLLADLGVIPATPVAGAPAAAAAAQVISLPPGWALAPTTGALRAAWLSLHVAASRGRARDGLAALEATATAATADPAGLRIRAAIAAARPVSGGGGGGGAARLSWSAARAADTAAGAAIGVVDAESVVDDLERPVFRVLDGVTLSSVGGAAGADAGAAPLQSSQVDVGAEPEAAAAASASEHALLMLFLVARLATINAVRGAWSSGGGGDGLGGGGDGGETPTAGANARTTAAHLSAPLGDATADLRSPASAGSSLDSAAFVVDDPGTTHPPAGARSSSAFESVQQQQPVEAVGGPTPVSARSALPTHAAHGTAGGDGGSVGGASAAALRRGSRRTLLQAMAAPQQTASTTVSRRAPRHGGAGGGSRLGSRASSAASDDSDDDGDDGADATPALQLPHVAAAVTLPSHLAVDVDIDVSPLQVPPPPHAAAALPPPPPPLRFSAPLCWWERDAALDALCAHAYGGGWRGELRAHLAAVGSARLASLVAARAGAAGTRSKRSRVREAALVDAYAAGVADARRRRAAFAAAVRPLWPDVALVMPGGSGAYGTAGAGRRPPPSPPPLLHCAHGWMLDARAPGLSDPPASAAAAAVGGAATVAALSSPRRFLAASVAAACGGPPARFSASASTAAVVATLLRAVYTGDAGAGIDVGNAAELLAAASRARLRDVAAAAEHALLPTVDATTVMQLSALADDAAADAPRLAAVCTVVAAAAAVRAGGGVALNAAAAGATAAASGTAVAASASPTAGGGGRRLSEPRLMRTPSFGSTAPGISTTAAAAAAPTAALHRSRAPLPPRAAAGISGRGRGGAPAAAPGHNVWAARRAESLGRSRPPVLQPADDVALTGVLRSPVRAAVASPSAALALAHDDPMEPLLLAAESE